MLRYVVVLCCLTAMLGCGANTTATTQSPEKFKQSLLDIEKQQTHHQMARPLR